MGRPKANAHIDQNATDLASIMARTLRRCTICKQVRPVTKDFFRFKPSTNRFDARCINCHIMADRELYSRDRVNILRRKKLLRDADLGAVARRRWAYYLKTRTIQIQRIMPIRFSPNGARC